MKKILVLTDFSPNSVNTYGYAVKLACQLKANILLLFSTNGAPLSITNQLQYSQQLYSFAKRYACDSRRHKEPHHTECLISGDAWAGLIPSMVEVHRPDLIIAGCGLLEAIERGVKELPVQEFAACPILWVPEKATYQPWQDLVFATDFTDQEPGVVQLVKSLAKDFNAKLHPIHFYPETEASHFVEIKKLGAELNEAFNTAGSLHVIGEEDMMEGLQDFAEVNPADVFVIATKDLHLTRHYLQDAYRKTGACQTKIPLLSLFQNKKKPCTGSCTYCKEVETVGAALVAE
ncbi:universal stress protein [Rufibacter roseus]|uniref:Universal stress protein n=1 Tax=Rufibacter roseus TaxID=1567108 RepID=A0ABW2DQ61_9BACT|nr:universal stress protein [Rufibacter roseus]